MKKAIRFTFVMILGALGLSNTAWAGGWGGAVRASGDFTVEIDFSSLQLTPVGENCLLTVEGVVHFTGTLEGFAPARTRALAQASCDVVATTPPGSYEDVFTSAFEFAGTVDGRPVVADFDYRGRTEIGGEINAVLAPSNGLKGRLFVEGIVAQGGSYSGYLRIVRH